MMMMMMMTTISMMLLMMNGHDDCDGCGDDVADMMRGCTHFACVCVCV